MRTLSTLCLPPLLSVKLDLFPYHCCPSLLFLHPVLFLDYFSHQTFNFSFFCVFTFLCHLLQVCPSVPSSPPWLPSSLHSDSLPPPLCLSLRHCLVYPNVCLLSFTVITWSLFRPLQHQHPSVTTGITYHQLSTSSCHWSCLPLDLRTCWISRSRVCPDAPLCLRKRLAKQQHEVDMKCWLLTRDVYRVPVLFGTGS